MFTNTANGIVQDYLFARHMFNETNAYEYTATMSTLSEIFFRLTGLELNATADEFVSTNA